jgi:CheY-like chemotaxis protein
MKPDSTTASQTRRALVIDDDELVRATVTSILESAGYAVVQAGDGQHGLKLFHKHPVDLVITDILMPLKEGIETILEIRQRSPEVRIIAMTGGGSIGAAPILDAAQQLGADAVLSKPFSKADLLGKIEKAD